MDNRLYNQAATPENVWAIIQEFAKETDRRIEENDRRMKELQKTVGGIANNQGAFAEEYFSNSFERGEKNFFGESFDDVKKNLKNFRKGITDEFDIVMYNHAAVAIIEVKYKADPKDLNQVLKKAKTFRIFWPKYKDFKIYLGLASLCFNTELEKKCIEEGIAVIKQVGDKVVINDEHLKVF